MVTKGLPSEQTSSEGIGDGTRTQTYIPDYTVEAVTDLVILKVNTGQYAAALHAASLDRHLSTSEGVNGGFEFPVGCDAVSPLVEYTSRDQLLDSENSDDAAKGRSAVNTVAVSCDD